MIKLRKVIRHFSTTGTSKWTTGVDFDKEAFQREFDSLRPEDNPIFDKSMKVYGLKDG